MNNSGVMLLFFDLPTLEKKQRAENRRFLKFIKSAGYMMLQESVYVKLQRSTKTTSAEINALKKHIPKQGDIMVLPLSQGNFLNLTSLSGVPFDVSFLCDDCIIV